MFSKHLHVVPSENPNDVNISQSFHPHNLTERHRQNLSGFQNFLHFGFGFGFGFGTQLMQRPCHKPHQQDLRRSQVSSASQPNQSKSSTWFGAAIWAIRKKAGDADIRIAKSRRADIRYSHAGEPARASTTTTETSSMATFLPKEDARVNSTAKKEKGKFLDRHPSSASYAYPPLVSPRRPSRYTT